MEKEPLFEVAQLAHCEILSPKPEETVWFFTELLGLSETARAGQSVYLRAYEDWYHHTLKVTEAAQPGLGHVAWRTTSPWALERRVKVLEASGAGKGWIENELGHGPAYTFATPDGHPMEILWEVEYWQCPEDQRSPLLNRSQKRPRRGVPVRRLDHVNCLASNVAENRDFMIEQLGFRLRERKVNQDGTEAGAWLSVSALVHEQAFMRDRTGARGRLHHVAYWYSYPQHLFDLGDLCVDEGVTIEFGPIKHGTTQATALYVYEPGGNRIELFGDTGYLIFDPDWKPVVWTEADRVRSSSWHGMLVPLEFYLYGTPEVQAPEKAEVKAIEEAVTATRSGW